MSDLLPCPFCGKAPTPTARAEGLVWCASCTTGMPPDEWDARAPIVVTDAMVLLVSRELIGYGGGRDLDECVRRGLTAALAKA